MGLIFDGIWYLNLAHQLVWLCNTLLYLHLKLQLEFFLSWNLEIPLARGKDLWLEFHLEHCVA